MKGIHRGDAPSKSWGLGRSLAAQTLVFAVVVPLAPAAQCLGAASGIDAQILTFANIVDRGAKLD
jgi:hypothetical protein